MEANLSRPAVMRGSQSICLKASATGRAGPRDNGSWFSIRWTSKVARYRQEPSQRGIPQTLHTKTSLRVGGNAFCFAAPVNGRDPARAINPDRLRQGRTRRELRRRAV